MLNSITLFFILFVFWLFSSIFVGLNPLFIFIGGVICASIAFMCWRLGIINAKTSFMILQFGFYKFLFVNINKKLSSVISICIKFLNPKYKFKPVLDYVFLNKDSDAEAVLGVNLINMFPATICVAVKKRYIIVHSLGAEYFSPSEMYYISSGLGKVYDDSL